RRYVEVDDPDDRYVRVRVDGEDVEVPYAEALKGYSLEADYTRKAQALSQQRQELQYALNLQQALEANPEMTLRVLAEQYGQRFGQQQPQAPAEEDEYVDPLERQIAEERKARLDLEQRLAAREADQQLERAIGTLQSQYSLNEDDVREVVGVAYRMGLGVDSLPMIWKTMAYDRLSARVQAERDKQQKAAAEEAKRTAAKQQQSGIINSQPNGANGLTRQVDAGGRMTIREAIEAAFDQAERMG
ncbi:MAG TPA: hypothetical protein VGD41_02430, partial [Pyrinomonadaceae bacterium]